jgi:hypothetical protein
VEDVAFGPMNLGLSDDEVDERVEEAYHEILHAIGAEALHNVLHLVKNQLHHQLLHTLGEEGYHQMLHVLEEEQKNNIQIAAKSSQVPFNG